MRSVEEINRYAEFYKSLPHRGNLQWQLILADDPQLIVAMEGVLELTQQQAVDEFIENSCWSEDLPHLVGQQGTFEERRANLREAYLKTLRSAGSQPDYSVLTPLEEELFKLLYEVAAAYPEGQHSPPALKHAKRLLGRTREHALRLMEHQLKELDGSGAGESKLQGGAPKIMWHNFIRSKDWLHLGLYPYKTLCGMEFDGKGNGVPTRFDVFELRKKQSPFVETDRAPVTCPYCVEIIRLCKTIEVKDLPPEPPFTEEMQDAILRSIEE